MGNLKTKLIVHILALTIGIACFFLWNSHWLYPEHRVENSAPFLSTSQSNAAVSNTAIVDSVNSSSQDLISQVDFRNFTFPGISRRQRIRVQGGQLEFETDHCLQMYRVQKIDYLDFTGDGEDEALVRMIDHEACGSSWASVYHYVYTMRNDRPRLLWSFATGSEAHGGLKEFRLEGTELVFELYGKWRVRGTDVTFYEDRPFPDDGSPTHYTVVRFSWDGARFRPQSLVIFPFTRMSIY